MANIGVIGTGLMGEPMAMRLLDQADCLTVYNRTTAKTQALQAQGAQVATTPTEVFEQADVIILMLTDANAIADLLFEPAVPLKQRTVIQMGTIAPQQSQNLHDRITSQGGAYFEAPVLGSIPEAKSGKLIVMVGATTPQFEQWQALLQQLGPDPTLVGPVGTAAAVKLALNQLIGSLTTAFGLSLALTQKAGVDPDIFMGILRQSALYAPTFDKKLTRMLEQNYANPNFPAKHLLKDMQLFHQAADDYAIPTELIAPISQLLHQTVAAGLADGDYSALFSQIQSP
ncbi:NAD(P)-dependent oxidoreductase [filamentous cyanobacterium LEGE 11480]|uniref:NAD(P)-dependent oxidoreductase n=1 Tax=Romeriopsis navalis LEGE 11480 TaxID=2777977 RepID=A0A928VML8_9CYAN|nr:NAD(P)-dependent oxidoreductase [Romeriopsis navalis]MBE9029456.1 NAD(P)-dependent oxidoreductase [Romeriopsis navalis LEGE 11480]